MESPIDNSASESKTDNSFEDDVMAKALSKPECESTVKCPVGEMNPPSTRLEEVVPPSPGDSASESKTDNSFEDDIVAKTLSKPECESTVKCPVGEMNSPSTRLEEVVPPSPGDSASESKTDNSFEDDIVAKTLSKPESESVVKCSVGEMNSPSTQLEEVVPLSRRSRHGSLSRYDGSSLDIKCPPNVDLSLDPRWQIYDIFRRLQACNITNSTDENSSNADGGLINQQGSSDFTTCTNSTDENSNKRRLSDFTTCSGKLAAPIFTVWRPTSSDAIDMMVEGKASGKSLNIKGKSAKCGLLSGYVPFLQIHEESHKRLVSTAPKSSRIKLYFRSELLRNEAVKELEVVLKEMSRKVVAANQLLERSKDPVIKTATRMSMNKIEIPADFLLDDKRKMVKRYSSKLCVAPLGVLEDVQEYENLSQEESSERGSISSACDSISSKLDEIQDEHSQEEKKHPGRQEFKSIENHKLPLQSYQDPNKETQSDAGLGSFSDAGKNNKKKKIMKWKFWKMLPCHPNQNILNTVRDSFSVGAADSLQQREVESNPSVDVIIPQKKQAATYIVGAETNSTQASSDQKHFKSEDFQHGGIGLIHADEKKIDDEKEKESNNDDEEEPSDYEKFLLESSDEVDDHTCNENVDGAANDEIIDDDEAFHIVTTCAMDDPRIIQLDGYAPESYGINVPERLLWRAYVLHQDITREPGSPMDIGRKSEPGFMDLNLQSLRSPSPPRPVVYQLDKENAMNPLTLLMGYEEDDVRPVASDFDPFLIGSKSLTYKPLGNEQIDIVKWCVGKIKEILENPSSKPWTKRWLDILKKESNKGFHPEIPPSGFGDAASIEIIEKAIHRLKGTGAVRHGPECFNFYFPQDLDDHFLVVSDTFGELPWRYLSEEKLRDFLVDRIREGYLFPINAKWALCDKGWYEVWERLLESEQCKQGMDCWFPIDSGIREEIAAIHQMYPDGFNRIDNGHDDDDKDDIDPDIAALELKRHIALTRAKRKLRILLMFMGKI